MDRLGKADDAEADGVGTGSGDVRSFFAQRSPRGVTQLILCSGAWAQGLRNDWTTVHINCVGLGKASKAS